MPLLLYRFRVGTGASEPAPAPAPAPPFATDATGGSGQITITWDPPTLLADGSPIGEIVGYMVYWGQVPGEQLNGGAFTGSVGIGSGLNTRVVTGLAAGTWYVAVSCLNVAGESDPSNEMQVTVL